QLHGMPSTALADTYHVAGNGCEDRSARIDNGCTPPNHEREPSRIGGLGATGHAAVDILASRCRRQRGKLARCSGMRRRQVDENRVLVRPTQQSPLLARTARISVELGTINSTARAASKASGDLRATACDRTAACKALPLKSQATARWPARS